MTVIVVPAGGKFVVSLREQAPVPRYGDDAGPWTRVQVGECTDRRGPFQPLGEAPLDPVDEDPSQPQTRSITIKGARLPSGWYQATFLDADDFKVTVAPVWNGDGWAPPSVQDIADLCPAYTRKPVDEDGAEQGIFDETTNPTASQVQAFIEAAVQEVSGRVGTRISEAQAELAARAAAWHAAATVEAERMPDGADETVGAFRWKQASYVACLTELIDQCRRGGLRIS